MVVLGLSVVFFQGFLGFFSGFHSFFGGSLELF